MGPNDFNSVPTPQPLRTSLPLVLLAVYVMVAGLAVFGVYAWQAAKLDQVKKDLSVEQAKVRLPNEAEQLDKASYQAVFVANGQTYFGKIGAITERSLTLTDIYYLRTNSPVQSTQAGAGAGEVALTKLGCELHGPADKMVINRDRVEFWENLKSSGKVAKAIALHKNGASTQACQN